PPAVSAADSAHRQRGSVPELAMGSLALHAYTAVFAFLLQQNGWPPGSRRFDASDSVLNRIRLDRLGGVAATGGLALREFIAGKEEPPPNGAGPSESELAGPNSANWPYHTGNYSGTR